MECFRRAALIEQTFAGRELELKYGDRLVRSFAALALTLDRHRGKGQQVVKGSGARAGNRNALKHGLYSREVLEFRHATRELLCETAEKLELV